MLAKREDSCVVLIDVQRSFLDPIDGSERVLRRCRFLVEIGNLLGVPVIATEQYTSRMGGTMDPLVGMLPSSPIPKMTFSCSECDEFTRCLKSAGKRQAVLIGIETHICVNQTAHHLVESGYEVFVGADAVGARQPEMHQIGLQRMSQAGVVIAHTESIVYEWLHSADDPQFREALKVVKSYAV